jgi:magnesium and cobalt exporter, CNNM family
MLLLVLIVVLALSISGICSILEASLLSSSTLKLSQRAETGDKGAKRLLNLKENRIDDAISAILTWNTIAHTVGAALSGAQAAVVFGDAWVGLFSGVLTLLILIFTEIIPKTVGTIYANGLSGFTGKTIHILMLPPMGWLLIGTRVITRMFARKHKQGTTRSDVHAILKLAADNGNLASEELKMLANLLEFEKITVNDVMTPRSVVTMFEKSQTLSDVIDSTTSKAFSRFPIYHDEPDSVIGYVLQRDLLRAAVEDSDSKTNLKEHIRPILSIDETATVGTALKLLTKKNEQLAIVLNEFAIPSGLVTLEDLFETALGIEIVDESDQVEDMRNKAMELRDERIARMKSLWKSK